MSPHTTHTAIISTLPVRTIKWCAASIEVLRALVLSKVLVLAVVALCNSWFLLCRSPVVWIHAAET